MSPLRIPAHRPASVSLNAVPFRRSDLDHDSASPCLPTWWATCAPSAAPPTPTTVFTTAATPACRVAVAAPVDCWRAAGGAAMCAASERSRRAERLEARSIVSTLSFSTKCCNDVSER